MASDYVKRVLIERRKRLVGTVMGHAERVIYPQISRSQQDAFRDCVLAAVGSYHDVVLDLLSASIDDGGLVNEEALRKLDDLHRRVIGA